MRTPSSECGEKDCKAYDTAGEVTNVTTARIDIEVDTGIAEIEKADRQDGTSHSAGCYSDEEEHETDASSTETGNEQENIPYGLASSSGSPILFTRQRA